MKATLASAMLLGVLGIFTSAACSGAEKPNDVLPPDAGRTDDAGFVSDADATATVGSDGSDGSDASSAPVYASGARCDGRTGLCAPSATCTPTAVCNDAIVGVTPTKLSLPLTVPTCQTSNVDRPMYDDGPPRRWTDPVTGEERAACVYVPPTATMASKLPVVVYLHGAGGSASAVYDRTLLRDKAPTAYLSGDLSRRGFILVANQGRNLVGENGNPAGARHDMYYRDFAKHPDVRAIDQVLDDLVASGVADPTRLHVTGWSNGAFFGQLYGLLRHEAPTKGGNRVASVVAFDGADPYQAPSEDALGCALAPYPRSSLPVMLIHRSCSIVPCDAAQKLALTGPPGFDVGAWANTLASQVGARDVENLIVGIDGKLATTCTPSGLCSKFTATRQHILWPDGVTDGGTDFEPSILRYMRTHPLP